MYDGGATYAEAAGVTGLSPFILGLNKVISHAAFALALAQIPFIINFFWSIKHGKKVASDNPWDATTLEWQTPTPPGHGNFTKPIEVFRGPYEYSVPGHALDFIPQNDPGTSSPLTHGHPVHG
jgi:cytochrome c oxidase subunit 1